MAVVCWLFFQVRVPLEVNEAPGPLADLLVGDFGVHFLSEICR